MHQAQDRVRRPSGRPAPQQGRTAIIADPRNDENSAIAGLHAAFPSSYGHAGSHEMYNHRALPGEVFRQARQLTHGINSG